MRNLKVERKMWVKLSDAERETIIDALEEAACSAVDIQAWIVLINKLKSTSNAPQPGVVLTLDEAKALADCCICFRTGRVPRHEALELALEVSERIRAAQETPNDQTQEV